MQLPWKVKCGVGRERGISTIAATVILIVAIAIGGIAVFYSLSPASGSSSCTLASSQLSSSASDVHVSMYSGGANPSNAPGYIPDTITLVVGVNNSVTWRNDDSAAHTVTSTNAPSCASFDSGNVNSGGTYTHTFTVPGTYHYYCKYHSWMSGTIVVRATS